MKRNTSHAEEAMAKDIVGQLWDISPALAASAPVLQALTYMSADDAVEFLSGLKVLADGAAIARMSRMMRRRR